MSSLLDHLDSNQSENDDIHLLFPKCKPRASSVGTESQSSESQSNSQQYLADNYRDQNLNHHHHSLSNQFPLHPHHNHNHHQQQLAGGGSSSSSSTRQSSRRHSSSGFTQITPQHHQQQQQPIIPDNLLKHAKHSSYPPLLNTSDQVANNSSFITNSGQLSPYDNNNLTHDNALGSNNSITNKSHHHHQSSSSSSRHYYHHHHQQQQQLSDSSDNFPVVVPSSHYTTGSSERGGGHIQTNSNNSSLLSSSKKGESSSKSHHHSRSKNSISSRNSRHEAAASASGSGSGVAAQNISQSNSTSSRHSHHHSRSHHHHRSKKLAHMTESSSCEPISPSTSNLGNKSSSHRYGKSRVGGGEGNSCGGPTKSYSSLSLGSGMECEPLDDPHHPHHRHHHQQQQQHHLNYDDGFSSNSRSQRNLATSLISNGASSGGGNNGGGGVGCLRDSRIEIAGGREIYSQNRIRAGRRLRGSSSTSSSTEMMADSSMSITASSSSSTGTKHSRKKSPNLQHQLQQHSFTNGGEMVDGDDLSVWEPKHSGGSNTIPPRSSSNHHHHHNHHQSSSGGGLGSGSSSHRQHHHHHSHQQQQQQHPSHHHQQSQQHHTRSRHGCNYSHCDHSKQDMSPPGNGSNPITVKETVFSSEVTSIEKALESNSKNQTGTKNTGMGSSYIYETSVMNDTCGEIIFDDIGNWNRNRERGRGGGGRRNSSAATEGGGLCVERRNKDQSSMMRRSPSTGANKHGGQLNFFQNGGGGGSGMSGAGANIGGENEMHCFNSLEQMEQHSGSSINASSAPTVLLHGSPSPSTRGGNTTPSGYESDEYSGVTPVSLNMIGSGGNSGNSRTADKGCLPNNRLIGALPIAEYEGSPKRYGLRQPTHPMPTHFDLVDVDMQMNSGASTVPSIPINSSTLVDQSSHLHQLQKSHPGSGTVVQSVSLISPTQSSKPTVPTSASSSSSSLDNTNSNSASVSSNSSGSVHHNNHNHHHHHHRNIYGNGRIISPRIISPSQSISSFPSRVPGFPQRITTPVTTSSLDSGSLVDSGLEKSDATDVIKSDIIKGGSGMMGEMSGESDMLISNSSSITTAVLTATTTAAAPYHPNSITNDECIRGDPIMSKSSQQPPAPQQQRHRQSTCYPATSAQQQQKSSFLVGGDSSFRSSDDNDEPPPSSVALCQGQLVSEREHHSSSDLLLTDQLNLEAEKCNPSINQTNLCGNPLDLEGELPHQQLQHAQPQQKPQQYHNMILELVDSGSGNSSGGGGLVEGDSQSQQQNIILSGNNNSGVERDGNNDQCLISVPSLSSTAAGFGGEKQFYSSSTDDKMGSELLGMSGVAGGGASNVGLGGNSNNPTDYLYEFSETRKVLEEFFGGGGIGGSSGGACGVVGSGIMELDGNNISSNLNHNGAQQLSQQQQFQQDPHIHQQQQGQFFDDLGYTLKRQTGNSYVGQRLAGESGNCSGNGAVGLVLGGGSSAVEESPKKPARRGVLLLGSCDGDGGEGGDAASPRLISFQEITSTGATTPISLSSAGGLGGLTGQGGIGMSGINKSGTMNPPSTRDLNDNDIDDGDSSTTNTETDNLGDTEVGLQVGLSRNFTLSPETTDCDSNELESEISLDYEASLHSSSRVGASMPAVEDGLSSGNVSDNEEQLHHSHHHHHTYQHQHASSEQLSNDLLLLKQQRNSSQQQPNLLPTLNSTPNSRQISSGVPHRREHHHHRHHQNHPHHNSHHQQQHHNHPHLIDDDLSCYGGSEQEGASGIGSGTNPTTTATTGTTASSCSSLSTTVQGTVSVPSQGGATAASSSSTAISSLNISSSSSSNNNSGNISNNANKIPSDPNPTLLLMKKQISEIEKEIKMRASQQNQKMQQQNQQTFSSPNNNTQQQQFNDDGELVGNGSGNGGSAQNISGGGGGNGSGGSSGCVTNGNNGLGSQLNVSSCPDVSTLVAVASAAGIVTGQGSSSHSQTQANSVPTNGDSSVLPNNMVSGNNGHHHHHHHHSHLQHSSSLKEQGTTEKGQETNFDSIDIELEALDPMRPTPPPSPAPSSMISQQNNGNHHRSTASSQPSSSANLSGVVTKATPINIPTASSSRISTGNNSNVLHKSSNESNNGIPIQTSGMSPDSSSSSSSSSSVAAAIQDIKEAIQKTKALPRQQLSSSSSHNIIETSTSRPTSLASAASLQQQNQQQQHQSLGDSHNSDTSPVWVPRQGKSSYHHHRSGGGGGVKDPLLRKQRYDETPDDDADTDQETDRLLGQTRTEDDYGFYDEKDKDGIKKKRSKEVLIEGVLFRARYLGSTQLVCEGQPTKATRMMQAEEAVSRIKTLSDQQSDHSSETEQLAATCNVSDSGGEPPYHDTSKTSSSSNNTTTSTTTDPPIPSTTTTNSTITSTTDPAGEDHPPPLTSASGSNPSQFDEYIYAEEDESGDESCEESEFFHKRARHHQGIQSPTSSARSFQGPCFGGSSSPGDTPGGGPNGAAHFGPACGSALPGTMFRLKFVGSLEVDEESGSGRKRRKRPKKTMVEEAVMKMKAPEGETQPSTEVDLFISTEKIMVLNTDLKEIMMDHALRTISYIADIGDLVVLMARRRPVPSDTPDDSKIARPPKMICHVFESDEAQYIAQSIGQAFQVAYMEFLKANGIEDQSFVREMDYQEVLNSQEIFGDELQMFAKKELHKEVVVPKVKGEMLGVVIVESGWGSLIPTVVIANLAPAGAAARCGQLNIGDQIIAINGVSLVGLPLSTCQNYIKNTKSQTVVKLTVVPCPPVVEVKIKRPDTKYQLGFSVQNGVICSLLRGGIAERGGVRVGHRIIEINGQSVVAVPHEKIVNLLATSVGEINMKTMPTSMFRLLTGQENPLYI